MGVLDDEIYRQEMQHNLYLVQNPEKRIGMVLYENINRVGLYRSIWKRQDSIGKPP